MLCGVVGCNLGCWEVSWVGGMLDGLEKWWMGWSALGWVGRVLVSLVRSWVG